MKVYNVELFSQTFEYLSSTQVKEIDIDFDYLDVVKNKISAPNIVADIGGYIRISHDNITVNGIVTNIEIEQQEVTVSFKDIMDICNIDILIDPTQLKTKTMEGFISDYLKQYYVNNTDYLQVIQGLTVNTYTGTSGTSLSIENPIDNFFKNVIYNAFLKHGIVVTFELNAQQKKIECKISKNISENVVIESTLPNIIDKKIEVGIAKESINKLIVLNEDNLAQSMIFYLHTDSSVSAVDANRILPVIFTTETVTVGDGEVFSDVALEKAIATLKPTEYNNLIEIEVMNDDDLVKPYDLKIGQTVTVIDNGNQYQSILTGKKINGTTTLIFGAIRKELTKKIKWGY